MNVGCEMAVTEWNQKLPALYDSLALKKNANSEDRVRIPKRAQFFL